MDWINATAFIKGLASPRFVAVLLHTAILPVGHPLRETLQNCGYEYGSGASWRLRRSFGPGGSGGITIRRVQVTEDNDVQAAPLRDALAALVQLLASKELESSMVIGELFSSLLLTYMSVRQRSSRDEEGDKPVQSNERDQNDAVDGKLLTAMETLKTTPKPMVVELTLALLLAVIESLGPSVLQSATTILQCINTVLSMYAQTHESVVDRTTDPSLEDEDDEDILTVCLGVVMTILEAGATQRAEQEEASLREMLPVLEGLSQHSRPQIAELASSARVQILARTADDSEKKPQPEKSFEAVLLDAQQDLQSPLVPLRARGVVTLTKLVRRSQLHRDDETWTSRVPQLMDIFMQFLADAESYVFLAAVQGLSTLAEAHPDIAIPLLVGALRDSKQHSLERRIKLSEALLFAARRCGETLPNYSKLFVYGYLDCIRPAPRSQGRREAPKVRPLIEEVAPAREEALDQPTLTTHPDADALVSATLRASCLSNLAEVSAMLGWGLAPYATDVMTCAFGVLQLELDMADEGVVAVRRGAVFLLKYMVQLMGYKLLDVVPDQLRPMYQTLKHVERVDKDAVVQFHARTALMVLDDVMRNELMPRVSTDEAMGGAFKMLHIVKH
ncbi:hypothetical protein PINS_up007161 [Pythium insidiosum]|nr:hypothetical protein PINS_up007161 [Pythium insidiosum]